MHFLSEEEADGARAETPHAYLHQFHKVALAFKIMQRAENERGGLQYQVVLRLRSDLILRWPPRLEEPGSLAERFFARHIRLWRIAPHESWLAHDWAWLAGRQSAEYIATAWQQMCQLGLLADQSGHARWWALAHLRWTSALRSAWSTIGSNFLQCLPFPASHLRRHKPGRGTGLLLASLELNTTWANSTRLRAFWDDLPLAVAEARRGSQGASPRASYLKSCWWYQRRNGTISTLLEPEVALGLALFQQQADVRLLNALNEIPSSILGPGQGAPAIYRREHSHCRKARVWSSPDGDHDARTMSLSKR